jgi:hypothetical protein
MLFASCATILFESESGAVDLLPQLQLDVKVLISKKSFTNIKRLFIYLLFSRFYTPKINVSKFQKWQQHVRRIERFVPCA